MPNREDEYWAGQKEDLRYCPKHKRYYRQDIGCQLCWLESRPTSEKTPLLEKCPDCDERSLFWNRQSNLYECLNPKCKQTFTEGEVVRSRRSEVKSGGEPPRDRMKFGKFRPKFKLRKRDRGKMTSHTSQTAILRSLTAFLRSRWLLAAVGLAIVFGSIAYYPFLIQNWRFGHMGIIKWLEIPLEVFGAFLVLVSLFVRRHWNRMKAIRVFLILLVLFTAGTYTYRSLSESGKIAEWLRRSSTKETITGNVAELIPSIAETVGELKLVVVGPSPTPATARPTASPTPVTTRAAIAPTPSPATTRPTVTLSPTAVSASNSRVWIGNAYIAGADGHPIRLINNPSARNPSWSQLVTFLNEDPTDKHEYNFNSFVCADFAEMLHSNAEKVGWRTAYVVVKLSGYKDSANLGIPSNVGHALNAFETTDRGLVYIDCVRPVSGVVRNSDKIVDVRVGKEYVPRSIFPEAGWSSIWKSMGVVTEVEATQW